MCDTMSKNLCVCVNCAFNLLENSGNSKKKVFRPMGGGLFTCKAQWKMDIKTKTLLFFVVSKLEFSFSHTSSWVSFFYCRSLSHSFFNVSIVCQVPPWGPHLTSSLLIISCLIDVLYLLLFVLLVFKGPYRDPTHLLE